MESVDKIQGRIAELRDKRDADRQQCTEAIAKGKAAIARLQAELVNIDPITDRKSIVQRNNDIRDCETCIGNLNTRLEGLKHSLINDEEYSTGVTTMYEDLDAITAKAKTTIDKALKTLSPLHEEYSDSVSMAADTMTARESVHGETHMYIDRKKPKAECYSNVRALHKAATTLQAVAD